MLPDATLPVPASLASLLAAFAPVFTAPVFTAPSFRTFCGLACGFPGQTGKRTVCGMLTGAGLSGSGRMTGRTPSSPGRAGIPVSSAWRWPGWPWRCWCPPGSR